jgi:3-oxoacyl-[acyl-carrier-protein] synthase III
VRNVRVLSTGSYLPGDPITNKDLDEVTGGVPDDILEGLQTKYRHWIADIATGEQSESNSDMATKAISEALDLAGIGPGEVDLLVVSTASPEYHLPPTATLIQEKLGLACVAATDIRSGCAGAVEALDLAKLYLERGDYETAVVVGSEAVSPLTVPVFLGKDPKKVRMRDKLAVYAFGDGAAAMVLRAGDKDGDGVRGSAIAAMGGDRPIGMQVVGGGTHAPFHEQVTAKKPVELKVDVVESGRFTPYVLTEGLRETIAHSGTEADSIDICVIPEGNASYMTDELREAGLLTPEWTSLQPKIFENLTLVGATGSAAVPLALDHAWKTGAVSKGDMVMLLAIETSRWKYAGWVFPWTADPVPADKRIAPEAGREERPVPRRESAVFGRLAL